MRIWLFNENFSQGQKWTATFINSDNTSSPPVSGTVFNRRDITDPTGNTVDPQLIITVPNNVKPGPTSIQVNPGPGPKNSAGFTIDSSQFTIMGPPVETSETQPPINIPNYVSGVGADGTLYIGLKGLQSVCDPATFAAQLQGNPVRFSESNVVIFNFQGYLIDALTPASSNHFSVTPGDENDSDILNYSRHSFVQYCNDHLPGHPLMVDPADPNWHKDGTPHVDYSTIIFAIPGYYDDGSLLTPGALGGQFNLVTQVVGPVGDWTKETQEENMLARHP